MPPPDDVGAHGDPARGDPAAADPARADVAVPEGIATEAVSAWIGRTVPASSPPYTFELIAGGRSNLTYRVTDAAGAVWALRRPPVGHVLPTAHDMAREHRVISALGTVGFPVPRAVGLCQEPSVNGSPFYLMEFVQGCIVRDRADAEHQLGEDARWRAGMSLAETLAQLHAIDIDHVGLGDFAKRDGYIHRQLRRWHAQFLESTVPGQELPMVVARAHQELTAAVPAQLASTVVHGDFRLDNVVLDPDGTVRAVLDWEICTLGDPLADLGLLMVYWAEPGQAAVLEGITATQAPGFPGRGEIRDRYGEVSGRDLGHLAFYEAFGCWKLACILQGVYARYAAGAAAGDRSSVGSFGTAVVELAERALATLEQQTPG